MKRFFTMFIVLIFAGNLLINAQSDTTQPEKNWKIGGDAALTFGQTKLINWSAGGKSSISLNGNINIHADYKKDKHIWTNNLIMAYGMYQEEGDTRDKNDDKIDFVSNYGYQMAKHWYYSVTMGFKSQFDKGFPEDQDTLYNSKFFAPAYLTLGLGLTYKPNDNLQLIISPATYRVTFVSDQRLADAGEYGVDAAEYETKVINDSTFVLEKVKDGKTIRHEFGADLKFSYKIDIVKNVNFQTNLELYTNYLKNPQNVDVYWDNYLTFTVNSWLAAKLTTSLIYDDDISIRDAEGNSGPRTQFKQTFGLGLSYKFGYQKE
ncbi:MAG TPA: DUF3078 domain-containing protein [Bacteroidales bacterium]|nr:DUF3078 domain-containing protein [Bacteroidales bacterium]